VAVGLTVGLLAARLINGLLFHVSTVDPLSIWIAAAALTAVATMAVSIPAARAVSVSPSEALRAE